MLLAFSLTLLAGLATAIGGAVVFLQKNPTDRFLAASLGFSAGVMLYVSFAEILPKGTDELAMVYGDRGGAWAAVGAFFVGILLIAVIDRLVPAAINPHERGVSDATRRRAMKHMGIMTAVALAIHNFPEGFATFLAGMEDLSIALPVAVAIAIHNIPEGIAVAVPLREATGSRAKAFGLAALSGLAEPAGALIGYMLLMPLLGPLALGVGFAMVAGIMVFICLDELLPTAVATGRHHTAIYGLIMGMAVMAASLLLFL